MDECAKTFCLSDRIVQHKSEVNPNKSKESATRFLNEVYEKGYYNETFNFVSTIEVNDIIVPFNQFYTDRYLDGTNLNKSRVE